MERRDFRPTLIDPGTPINPGGLADGQERRNQGGRQTKVCEIAVMVALTAGLIALLTAAVVMAVGEDTAAKRSAQGAVQENRAQIAREITLGAMEEIEVAPARAEEYAAQIETGEIQIRNCRVGQRNSSRYTERVRCDVSVHIDSPERVSIDGRYWVELEKKRNGITWPFTKLEVIDHGAKRHPRVETYGKDAEDL